LIEKMVFYMDKFTSKKERRLLTIRYLKEAFAGAVNSSGTAAKTRRAKKSKKKFVHTSSLVGAYDFAPFVKKPIIPESPYTPRISRHGGRPVRQGPVANSGPLFSRAPLCP
jgi:hypothetical protein